MNSFSRSILLAAVLLAMLLPSSQMHSQLVPFPTDPLAALQSLQKSNDDLLKRQDDTLKTLTDLTTTANEVRIYSRRG